MGDGSISFRKYRAPAEREALIQKLLQEREQHLAKERELEEWQRQADDCQNDGYNPPMTREQKPKTRKKESIIANEGMKNNDNRRKSVQRSGFTRRTIDQVKQEVKSIEAQVRDEFLCC